MVSLVETCRAGVSSETYRGTGGREVRLDLLGSGYICNKRRWSVRVRGVSIDLAQWHGKNKVLGW